MLIHFLSWLVWGGGSGNLAEPTPGPGGKGQLVGGGSPVANCLFMEGWCGETRSTSPLPWHLMTAVKISPVTPAFSTRWANPRLLHQCRVLSEEARREWSLIIPKTMVLIHQTLKLAFHQSTVWRRAGMEITQPFYRQGKRSGFVPVAWKGALSR